MSITHIGFIMDGNRRYGKKEGLSLVETYRTGFDTMFEMIKLQVKHGIKETSFFALSKDNYEKRSKGELETLFEVITLLEKEHQFKKFFIEHKIALSFRGDLQSIEGDKRKDLLGKGLLIRSLRKKFETELNKEIGDPQFYVNIAVNYDGHHEIVKACKEIAQEVNEGTLEVEDISDEIIKNHLWFASDAPQIIVRTGDAPRLSGFMLWDSKYSELYLTKKMWPEFKKQELEEVLSWYESLKRNFGK